MPGRYAPGAVLPCVLLVSLPALMLHLHFPVAAAGQGAGAAQDASVERARAVLASLETQLVAREAGLERQLRWLNNAVPTRPGASIPPVVVAGLIELDAALRRSEELPPPSRTQFLERLREDIILKAEYCRAHPDGMAALVPLTVRTWTERDGKREEAAAWSVAYVNAPLAVFGVREGHPFPQFSSPTSVALPPGRYVIWTHDPRDPSRRGPEKLVTLGAPGVPQAQEVLADLLVPAR